MAWDLLRHAAAMLWRNMGAALRVSIGPSLVGVLIVGLLLGLGVLAAGQGQRGIALLALLLASLFLIGWTAVAWHRRVLLDEPVGLLPPPDWGRAWPYVGRVVLLSLVVAVAAIPFVLALPLVLGRPRGVAGVVMDPPGVVPVLAALLVASTVLGWLFLRLALVLPARALDRPMRLDESWSATAPASGAVLALAAALAGLNLLPPVVIDAALGPTLAASAASIALGWATGMLALSLLTTLYGHLVERRPLG